LSYSDLFESGKEMYFALLTLSILQVCGGLSLEILGSCKFLEDPPEAPMADNRTMAQLLQAPTVGYEDAIVIPEITAMNFELKHGLINLVQNKQFFGHVKEDPHVHIRYFNKITSTMRVPNEDPPEVSMADNRTMVQLLQAPTEGYEDAIVIPEITATNFKLKHELHQLDTFYNALNVNDQDSLNSAAGGNFLDKMPSDCLKIIESKSKVRQSRAKEVVTKVNSSSSTPAISSDVAELKDMVRALLLEKKNKSSAPAPSPTSAPVKAVEPNCVTCGGTHSYQNCPATSGNVYQDNIQEYVSQAAAANYSQGNTSFQSQMVANQIRPPGFPPSQLHRPQVDQPSAYQAPGYQAPILQTQSVFQIDFERYVKANDTVLRNIQSQGQRSGTLPGNTITNPKKDLKGITTRSGVAYQGPTIPVPSKVVKQGTKVTKDQVQTSSSQSTAPIQPPVAQSETPVSEPVVAPVRAPMTNLKPSIPYPSRHMSFEISFTYALILMPKFDSTIKALIGNKEKLSEMARTPMNEHCSAVILNNLPKKLGDRGKFLIPCEFSRMDECLALVDLDESVKSHDTFRTGRALIDVHKGELTLRIGNEAITYNLDQTSRYSANYDQMTANKIDVTDKACEEYSQEVLGFSDVTASSSPTPSDDPIVSTTSPTLTPFEDSDFLLFEEADAFLGLEDDPDSPEFDPSYYDPEGDILLPEAILNSKPSPPLLDHEQSVPSFKEELKACEANTIKSFVDEPPEVELKDLPPHLEYAFLEGDNKFSVIIAKEMGDEEKSALIKVLKSHKQAIAWKLSDIQGINPEFCTHKILIEEDYKPAVSPVHCVPKKGGFTVVKNEENELIPTRLVTGWRVCIDYRKLKEATCKDHFPLPFMDQMLERLAGNEYYCFLDGFFGYFQIPIDPRDQEKQRLPALTGRSPTLACLSVCAMHQARFKGDAKARLLRWVLLLQEFDFDVLDTKGAENLAADHLSRLENPYENVLDPKNINETFPLETLSMMTFRGDSSALWFADFANYHVEAKALPTNDARVVCKFLKSLFARFGAPRAIISDHGTHFCNDQFAKVMQKYGVTHRLSTTYHPQTSRQVEVSNRGLKRILERTIG
nr:reverse transcriptase domain-containing protein [Tanacetum cinerariifolium]